ncbi:MAG TPA: DUF2283 domain-containing protein [Lacipirellulaceae bacterium]
MARILFRVTPVCTGGVVLDYDEHGNLVGIDIDNASVKLDLSEVVTNHIPHRMGA